jgi:hypothetical protein
MHVAAAAVGSLCMMGEPRAECRGFCTHVHQSWMTKTYQKSFLPQRHASRSGVHEIRQQSDGAAKDDKGHYKRQERTLNTHAIE